MLVGFCGGMASGKDTSHDRLKILYPDIVVERLAFATKLKESIAATLGVSVDYLNSIKRDPLSVVTLTDRDGVGVSMSIRQFTQQFGSEGHRGVFGENFWIDQTLPHDFSHEDKLVCVTDCRLPNELQRVRDLGGIIGYLEYSGSEGGVRERSHETETSISADDADFVIVNNIRDDEFSTIDEQLKREFDRRLK